MAVHEVSKERVQALRVERRTVRDEFPNAIVIRFHADHSATAFDNTWDAIGHPSSNPTVAPQPYKHERS
jgi:hypothetical protein